MEQLGQTSSIMTTLFKEFYTDISSKVFLAVDNVVYLRTPFKSALLWGNKKFP